MSSNLTHRRVARAALTLLPILELAQNYPTKAIALENSFAVGGGAGSIGTNTVARAQADGYELLFATSDLITNTAINETAAQDPVRTRPINEGAATVKGTPADFQRRLDSERSPWRVVIKTFGLQL